MRRMLLVYIHVQTLMRLCCSRVISAIYCYPTWDSFRCSVRDKDLCLLCISIAQPLILRLECENERHNGVSDRSTCMQYQLLLSRNRQLLLTFSLSVSCLSVQQAWGPGVSSLTSTLPSRGPVIFRATPGLNVVDNIFRRATPEVMHMPSGQDRCRALCLNPSLQTEVWSATKAKTQF